MMITIWNILTTHTNESARDGYQALMTVMVERNGLSWYASNSILMPPTSAGPRTKKESQHFQFTKDC
jgi:hypothetical protein